MISVNGFEVRSVKLQVPTVGPWTAEIVLVDSPDISGAVVLTLDSVTLSGTVISTNTYGSSRGLFIVAGAGGWSTVIAGKDYANDAGVKSSLVANDAARDCNETIGSFVPAAERLGVHYTRQKLPAARALIDAIGSASWWVDYLGVTNVGTRNSTVVDDTTYQVLGFDPVHRVAELSLSSASALAIGGILSTGLDAPLPIREFEIRINEGAYEATVWLNETSLASIIAQLARAALADKLYGKYLYRVVKLSGDRAELQAVNKSAGLPDVQPISLWPGIPGAAMQLTLGSQVLVEFIAGDRKQPVITGFMGQENPGFAAVLLTLGGTSGPAAARVGDAISFDMPQAIAPAGGGPVTWSAHTSAEPTVTGEITSGSSKVSIA